jgi:uncharacterized membrane protein YgcG
VRPCSMDLQPSLTPNNIILSTQRSETQTQHYSRKNRRSANRITLGTAAAASTFGLLFAAPVHAFHPVIPSPMLLRRLALSTSSSFLLPSSSPTPSVRPGGRTLTAWLRPFSSTAKPAAKPLTETPPQRLPGRRVTALNSYRGGGGGRSRGSYGGGRGRGPQVDDFKSFGGEEGGRKAGGMLTG